jgi:hypothetical protein
MSEIKIFKSLLKNLRKVNSISPTKTITNEKEKLTQKKA